MTGAAMIIKNSVDRRGTRDAAWSFLKWWVSGETQTSYAREMEAVLGQKVKKGDVFTVAQIAGISGAKRTSDLIPLCHNIALTNAEVTFETDPGLGIITVYCTAKTRSRTGVEMEALTGVCTALLTVYDMCKAIDKRMVIEDIHLLKKTGGKSGEFTF